MKEYTKPELEVIDFVTEVVANGNEQGNVGNSNDGEL